jgi:hydroxyacylglutathione hydrolase
MRPLTEVARGVLVATAVQYTTTSTVILGAASGCLIVDPAVTVAEVAGLADALAGRGLRPAAGWATHAHWDHVLWHRRLGTVPRYGTPPAAAAAQQQRAELTERLAEAAPGHDLDLFGGLTALAAGQVPWDGPAALVIEHAAHADGHGALYLPDSGTLLAGDMLSDLEIPLLNSDDPDPLGSYLAGLELLAALRDVRTVVPGHGHPGDHAEFRRRVAADLRYLDELGRGTSAAGQDDRIGDSWLRAEHDRQFAGLHG